MLPRQVTADNRKRVRTNTMQHTTKKIVELLQQGDGAAAEALHRGQLIAWANPQDLLTTTDLKSMGVALRHLEEAKYVMRTFYDNNTNNTFASITADAAPVNHDDNLQQEDLDGPATPAPKRNRLYQQPSSAADDTAISSHTPPINASEPEPASAPARLFCFCFFGEYGRLFQFQKQHTLLQIRRDSSDAHTEPFINAGLNAGLSEPEPRYAHEPSVARDDDDDDDDTLPSRGPWIQGPDDRALFPNALVVYDAALGAFLVVKDSSYKNPSTRPHKPGFVWSHDVRGTGKRGWVRTRAQHERNLALRANDDDVPTEQRDLSAVMGEARFGTRHTHLGLIGVSFTLVTPAGDAPLHWLDEVERVFQFFFERFALSLERGKKKSQRHIQGMGMIYAKPNQRASRVRS